MFLSNLPRLGEAFLLTTIVAMVESQPIDMDAPMEECCTKKMVGSVSYTLLDGPFRGQIPQQCHNDCVYTVSGTTSPKFCFQRGNLPTECLSEKPGLLEARYEYVHMHGTSEDAIKTTSTINDILLLISTKFPPPAGQGENVGFCGEDSVEPIPIYNVTLGQVDTCGLIQWDQDDPLSCNEIFNICDEDTVTPVWDLEWCPERIGNTTISKLPRWPQCCFNPITRKGQDVWDCLQNYMWLMVGEGEQSSGTEGLLETRYEYVQVLNEVTGDSENVTKLTSTVDDFLLLISQNFPPPIGVDGANITICDVEAETNETKPINDVIMGQITNADCGFILWENSTDNSTPSCSDLAQHCDGTEQLGNGATGQPGNELVAVSTLASWNLKWCPGRIKNRRLLYTFPQCCFHPITRPAGGLWNCLLKYA